MTTVALRLLITGWIGIMLLRAGRAAWRQRALSIAVWRRIRWQHVLGSLGLLVVVGTVATTLLTWVPGMSWGLGSLVGTSGNAVFLPLEEAAARAGPVPASGPDWVLIALATLFLGSLVLLFPWLAFVEEEVFRAGLEDAPLRRELATALVFGLVHLTMLVPLGAAFAVAVAGFAYGRAYRAAYARQHGPDAPPEVAAAYRPTKRAAAAAARSTTEDPRRLQAGAVLSSTVWHATFNTAVVVVVWLAIVVSATIA